MKTEFLSDWDVAAIECAVNHAVEKGILNKDLGGENLKKKLQRASHIRLSYPTQQSTI